MKILNITVLCFLAFNANASIINYDEATDGDIPFDTPSPYLLLGVGINSISGTFGWATRTSNINDDRDNIAITVPLGTRLESIKYTINEIPGNTGIIYRTFYTLTTGDFLDGSGIVLKEEFYDFPKDELSTFQTVLPLQSNDYLLRQTGIAGRLNLGEFASAAYTWEFDVSLIPPPVPAPVPSAVWLFGSGLLGLVGVARRKSRQHISTEKS